MGSLSQFMAKQTLDWTLGVTVATPSQPIANFVGLASIAINSQATTGEWATTLGYSRVSGNMAPSSTPAGSAISSNSASFVFGPVSAGVSASGIFLSDTVSSGVNGTFQYWGSLAVAKTLASGETLIFGVGALTITLA